jgi:hypothetical protein
LGARGLAVWRGRPWQLARPPPFTPSLSPNHPIHHTPNTQGGGNPLANIGGLMENMRKAQEEAQKVQRELSK